MYTLYYIKNIYVYKVCVHTYKNKNKNIYTNFVYVYKKFVFMYTKFIFVHI